MDFGLKNKMEHELFVCDCGDVSHQFVISRFYDEYEYLYVQVHLSNVGFWKRLKYSFYYILGKRSRFNDGAFSEVLLNKENTARLIKVLQENYERMN
jgi:hypothetical protein